MWITPSCRPGLAYQVSNLQTVVNKPLISDIVAANRAVRFVQETAGRGMVFRPGLFWSSRETMKHPGNRDSSGHGNLPNICIAAVSDASHGGEDEWLDDWEEREAFRSQGAKLFFIADASILDSD